MISVRLKGGTASFRPLQLLYPKGQISVFQVARSLAAALPGLALVLSAGGIALVIGHEAGLFRIARALPRIITSLLSTRFRSPSEGPCLG
ncbi:hypothetical protein [Rhizobium sp. BK379]|uniref:hypothetical protein n=1 Tax=Rhizobium sp. BK379 TaxID=2587059 RepID=UPI001609C09C|nr:hypothetical protein [Rhizobium sp. BK379]MBB3441294.1 hypothetical protein [Rhizobium sp. BK379]